VSCRKERRRILKRLDLSLALEEELLLERHLADCDACDAFQERAAALEEGLARLPEPRTERVGVEGAVAAIRARIDARPAGRPRPRRGLRRWAPIAAGVAAALLLALFAPGTRDAVPPEAPEPRTRIVTGQEARSEEQQRAATAPSSRPPTPAAGDEDARLDLERLADAREEVRALLLGSAPALAPAAAQPDARTFFESVERSTRHLRLQQWPVPRIVAGILESGPAEEARAAARYLGQLGDRTSVAALERAVARGDVLVDVVRALRDVGTGGLGGLELAARAPGHRSGALAAIGAVGGAEAANAVERIARLDARTTGAVPADVLAALVGLGDPGLDPLLRLGRDALVEEEVLLARLDAIPGAGTALVERLATWRARRIDGLQMRAAAQLEPERALPLIADMCLERSSRLAALDCLARAEDPGAVAALARLWSAGRISSAVLAPFAREAVERDPKRLAWAADRAAARGDAGALEDLLELFVTSGSRSAAPALSILARSPALGAAERRSAVLAIGEVGGEEHAQALVELFRSLGPDERHLAAACLLVAHELAGEEASLRALEGAPPRSAQSILSLLLRRDAEGRTTVSIYKLARELEPVLAEHQDWSAAP